MERSHPICVSLSHTYIRNASVSESQPLTHKQRNTPLLYTQTPQVGKRCCFPSSRCRFGCDRQRVALPLGSDQAGNDTPPFINVASSCTSVCAAWLDEKDDRLSTSSFFTPTPPKHNSKCNPPPSGPNPPCAGPCSSAGGRGRASGGSTRDTGVRVSFCTRIAGILGEGKGRGETKRHVPAPRHRPPNHPPKPSTPITKTHRPPHVHTHPFLPPPSLSPIHHPSHKTPNNNNKNRPPPPRHPLPGPTTPPVRAHQILAGQVHGARFGAGATAAGERLGCMEGVYAGVCVCVYVCVCERERVAGL